MKSFQLLLVIVLVATTWGCSGGPDLDEVARIVPPPQVAAVAQFSMPSVSDELFIYNIDREVRYRHSGSLGYSAAGTVLRTENGTPIRSHEDKELIIQGWYYLTSIINQWTFSMPADGSYTFEATYFTQSPNFNEQNGIRTTVRNRTFRICLFSNSSCISGNGIIAGNESASRIESGTSSNLTPQCEGDPEGCGGGGGGGSPSTPYFQRRVVHTESMGPFFGASNVGSDVSQDEIEDALEQSTPDQLDSIAPIILEAYGEDIYEYMRTGGSLPTLPASDLSPFLTLTDAFADPNYTPTIWARPFVRTLTRLREQYVAMRNAEGVEAGTAVGMDTNLGASANLLATPESVPAMPHISAWPNPVSSRLTIEAEVDGAVATVSIYDMAGRLVTQLRANVAGGRLAAVWDVNSGGARVASGVYRAVITVDGRLKGAFTVTVL